MVEAVLLPETRRFLKTLALDQLPDGSYLGGGTAIALQLGHRRSMDLDFFTPKQFSVSQWEQKLVEEKNFTLSQRDWQTLIGNVGSVKISVLGYSYRLIGKPDHLYDIPVASLRDLAAMKLDTILGRGTKRDLIDIYFLAHKYSLTKLFECYQEKYGNFDERALMIKKALIFFGEADTDEMPDMFIPISWEHIKTWLTDQVQSLHS